MTLPDATEPRARPFGRPPGRDGSSGVVTLAAHPREEGSTPQTALDRAREAVARRDWADAYAAFHDADRAAMTGSDLEAFADAAWWRSELSESLQVRKEAYAAYDAEGNEGAAGWQAGRLAMEHFMRGDPAVASGFLMRAQRHAADLPPGREAGFLITLESVIALQAGDIEGSLARIADAVRIGRELGDPELVAMAVHTQGLALIDAGRVTEGLALLDEAMASTIAGEVGPYFTGIIYCSLLSACLAIGDLRRAGEWADAAASWCDTIPPDSPYPGMCRANRAEVARLRGAWPEAEAEAERACAELMDVEPGIAAAAFLQLAEIRRRRGDLTGAEAAYARAHEFGEDPQPGLALLRLAQGKGPAARGAIAAALGSAGMARPHRVRLLAADVEIALAAGDVDEARTSADGLAAIASETGTPAFAAQASQAAGAVALVSGEVDEALARLREATTIWQDLRLPYEASHARVRLAQALRAAGDEEGATLELRAALAGFERLGAARDVGEVAGLLGADDALPDGLTPREAEVLRLVAQGKTNRDIAVELVISEHTVGRHLQNLYGKLGVSSRAAATAYAFEHGLT
jgi:DNA-binding NarL/FixJ family response regulator